MRPEKGPTQKGPTLKMINNINCNNWATGSPIMLCCFPMFSKKETMSKSPVTEKMLKSVSEILFILSESFRLYELEDYITAFELIGALIPKLDISNIMRVYFDYKLDLLTIIEIIDKDYIKDFCKAYTYLITKFNNRLENKLAERHG